MALAFATIVFHLLIKCLDAGPVPPPNSSRPCAEFQLPVTVTARNGVFDVKKAKTNIDVTAFAVDLDTYSSPNPAQRLLRNQTVSGTFNINAQLCVPTNGTKRDHLQIATHGAAFDKRYWDAAINPSEYSYVDAALAAGYSILTYDRLGTGLSDKPDADIYLQSPLELEILRGITEMARTGDLVKHRSDAVNITGLGVRIEALNVSFDKVIHVGHSFGSLLTTALLTAYGNLSDAAIITGSAQSSRFRLTATSLGLEYAPENDATLFGDRSAGYVVWGTRTAIQTGFFSTRANRTTGTGGFEKQVLDYAFSIRQTAGVTEFLSQLAGQLDLGPAVNFKGPVQYVLAEYDFLGCQGDCNGAIDVDMLKKQYPKATNIDIFIQRGTGHGLTLHKGAKLGYQASLDWLDQNGL